MRNIFGSGWIPLEPDHTSFLPEFDQLLDQLASQELEEGEIRE